MVSQIGCLTALREAETGRQHTIDRKSLARLVDSLVARNAVLKATACLPEGVTWNGRASLIMLVAVQPGVCDSEETRIPFVEGKVTQFVHSWMREREARRVARGLRQDGVRSDMIEASEIALLRFVGGARGGGGKARNTRVPDSDM